MLLLAGASLQVIGGADELDEVAVGVFDHGEGYFSAWDDGRAFGEDFHAGFLEALEGDLGAVDVDGEVAEAEAARDVGLITLFALLHCGLHELDGGGSFSFTEGKLLDDDFLASTEAGFFGDHFAGGEFAGGGEADRFGVELHRFFEVAYDDAEINGGGPEFRFVGRGE